MTISQYGFPKPNHKLAITILLKVDHRKGGRLANDNQTGHMLRFEDLTNETLSKFKRMCAMNSSWENLPVGKCNFKSRQSFLSLSYLRIVSRLLLITASSSGAGDRKASVPDPHFLFYTAFWIAGNLSKFSHWCICHQVVG